jgi:hypothetical protein
MKNCQHTAKGRKRAMRDSGKKSKEGFNTELKEIYNRQYGGHD